MNKKKLTKSSAKVNEYDLFLEFFLLECPVRFNLWVSLKLTYDGTAKWLLKIQFVEKIKINMKFNQQTQESQMS